MNDQNKKKVYLDVCTLCRPFDNQTVMRVCLETNAYYLILQAIQDSKYEMIVSPVHIEEINAITDAQAQGEISALLTQLGTGAQYNLVATRARAEYLYAKKFGIADAAHVAFAETTSDFFISCDDRLLKKCKRESVAVEAMNPVEFVLFEDLR